MNKMDERKEYMILKLTVRKKLCLEMLNKLPEGGLSKYTKNGHEYYVTHMGGRTRHLRVDDPLVKQLKDRYLVKAALSGIEEQIKLLEQNSRKRVEFDPNVLMKSFPEAYQNPGSDIIKAIGFEDARVWAHEPYIKNPKYPEHLTVTAWDGTKVRSRIEAAILEIYRDIGVETRYDELLVLPDGKRIYTDFHPLIPGVIRDKRHEHFGMLSDPEYLKNDFLWKNELFIRNDLIPQQDVLYTFDGPNGEINLPLIRRQILEWIERCQNE